MARTCSNKNEEEDELSAGEKPPADKASPQGGEEFISCYFVCFVGRDAYIK